MRTMYDSIHASSIPITAQMVAGYLAPSPFAWSVTDWARFPGATKVRIAVRASTDDGNALDVENGDATAQQAPGWVQMRRQSGADPTVYCSLAAWPSVRAAFRVANVPEPHYWIAHFGAGPSIPVGAVACQFIDPPGSGGDWDLSVVSDYWPGVDDVTDLSSVATLRTPDGKAVLAGLTYAQVLESLFEAMLLGAAGGATWPAGDPLLKRVNDLQVQCTSIAKAYGDLLGLYTQMSADVAALKGETVGKLSGTATVTVDLESA